MRREYSRRTGEAMNFPRAKIKRRETRAAPTNSRAWRDRITVAAIVALALWCGVFLTRRPLGIALDGALYDTGLTSRAPRTSDSIAIVGMTENFVQNRHVAFVPRARLAKLIDIIAAGKPAVIALDVWLDSLIDGPKIGSDDWKLRQAISRAKSRGIAVLLAQSQQGDDNRSGLRAAGAVTPFFKGAASGIGGINFPMDGDGVFRTLPRGNGALAVLAAREYSRRIKQPLSPKMLRRPAREDTPIDFAGGPNALRITPAETLLEKPVLALLLQNRIVFIGATYPRSGDLFASPYNGTAREGSATVTRPATGDQMYGVEMLANATFTVLNGAPRRSAQSASALRVLAAALFAVVALCVLLSWRGAWQSLMALIMIWVAAFFVAIYSASAPESFGEFAWPASPFLAAAALACGLTVAYRQVAGARELRYVTGVFGAHVGDELLEKLRGQMPQPGGEKRDIAVLFCDIAGFTALSEKLRDDPAKLLFTLNDHFEPLVQAMQKRGAFVDNYVGDLVMAIFGAPLSAGSLQAETRRAVLAALDVVRIVEERNALRREFGEEPIEVGVGVHCGAAVVGYLGSSRRIHYTAVGDTVNVASRVESATRQYDVPLLVTENVVQLCEYSRTETPYENAAEFANISWQFIAETSVKGRSETVKLYAPVKKVPTATRDKISENATRDSA